MIAPQTINLEVFHINGKLYDEQLEFDEKNNSRASCWVGTWNNPSMTDEEFYNFLTELRDKGVVKHVGITNLNLRHFKYVIDHVPDGMVESILSFCHYCLNDDALVDYLDYFESKNVGVINASPYAMGLLTERGIPEWHPAPAPLLRLSRKAVEYCKSKGSSIEQLAVSYCVQNPRIATTLFSTTSPENVLKTIRYAETPLDTELLADVQKIFEPGFRDTWVNS